MRCDSALQLWMPASAMPGDVALQFRKPACPPCWARQRLKSECPSAQLPACPRFRCPSATIQATLPLVRFAGGRGEPSGQVAGGGL